MGIELVPHERDDPSGISRLTVKYSTGAIESPARFVNRNDLNAKSVIGVDVGVTVGRRPFILEHEVNPKGVQAILTRNDYLATTGNSIEGILRQVDEGSFTVVHLKLTKDAAREVGRGTEKAAKVSGFMLDVMSEVKGADAYALPEDLLGAPEWSYIRKQSTPVIPVVDIKNNLAVTQSLAALAGEASALVPFIGFTHASYRNARLSYQEILAAREKLHEGNKGIMVLQTARTLMGGSPVDRDLSAPHYSSFLIADLVGERYAHTFPRKGTKPPVHVAKLFSKAELAVSPVAPGSPLSAHAGESAPFAKDPKILELFNRTAQGQNSPEDWKNNRPSSISRLHETINSAGEFEAMRVALTKGELATYTQQKKRLSDLISQERTAP